eukprot:CAMPEP_0172931706 /NCGR_PEP_ID=MMETSP1075-20121228/219630_1 /TAXON_ID=2916 /ORGANISM="Ceratium fusus, Strain PA161109" /LENGTH=751 /DNA_ID=CAMNT_0013793029 /DNA_START=56 /DNA_END=2311 /DNA_ORIENTATION=+
MSSAPLSLVLAVGLLLFTARVGAMRDEATRQRMTHNEGDPGKTPPESVFDLQMPEGTHFCNLFKGCDILGELDYNVRTPAILVVGAGSAGLMAALEAESGGAKVIMIEKRTAGKFERNNVLALDPMTMDKLKKIGVADKLFTQMDDLPKYKNADEWKQACVNDASTEVSKITQDDVKCLDGEGAVDGDWGFIRTKCLERRLFHAVKTKNIIVSSNTEFVGMAIDEIGEGMGKKYYAVLRISSIEESHFKFREVVLPVDAIMLAVGSSIINQIRQEFRKWYVVDKKCTNQMLNAENEDHCPQWLISAHRNQQAVKNKAKELNKTWPSNSLEASDMLIMHKKVANSYVSPKNQEVNQGMVYSQVKSKNDGETKKDGSAEVPIGWEGLPTEDLGFSIRFLLVGIRDRKDKVCKNWIRKAPHEQEHKWQELRRKGFVENQDYNKASDIWGVKDILQKDTEFTKKFVWNLEYYGTQKQSYAMTGLFIPLKVSNQNWTDVRKNHVWNPENHVFEELSNNVRGANWLGKDERKQQIRLFPNKCLVYLTIGLTNSKAKELMTSSHGSAEPGQQTEKQRCEEAALSAEGCDKQTAAQAEKNCDFLDNWENLQVAPSCDVWAKINKPKFQDCKLQLKNKQIALLREAALDSGLLETSVLVPSSLGGRLNHHTFFDINLFNLGPTPSTREPLFLLGDAAHAPNFLSGCGVVGGQDDTAAVGHYTRWMQKATGLHGWPSKEETRQCTADMLKVVQNLVYESST